MNEPPNKNNEEYQGDLVIKNKSESSPLIKEEAQLSLPKNAEELELMMKISIKEKELKTFKDILSKCSKLLTKDIIVNILKKFIKHQKKRKIYSIPFFKFFVEFIDDPNIILDIDNKKESLLMVFCEISNFIMISILSKKKIKLDVNYEDNMKRNALFYLKGGVNDKNIIELLIKEKINVNHKDNDGNTALHFIAINNTNIELIYNLINIGEANFMIKNKQNISSLELINLKYISKKDADINKDINIFNFFEIKKLIQLIKKKLSMQSSDSITKKDEELNLSSQSQNLFKIPSLLFNKNNYNEVNKNDEENNIYLSLKKNPSLIIGTQFNGKSNNNLSFSQKLEYYKQLNKNKKIFLNFLKNSENYLVEKSKIIKTLLEERKKELNKCQKELNFRAKTDKEKNNDFINNLNGTNLNINEINDKIKILVNEINQKEPNYLIKTNYQLNKFQTVANEKKFDYKKYIWNQLTIDLKDYCVYINARNQQLNKTINEIYGILLSSVKDCLGKNYEIRIYGSRATGLCLPWSDIDFVIVVPNNIKGLKRPLDILNSYLEQRPHFIEEKKYISTTQVPIIKIKTTKEYFNLALDISVELPSHHGQQCVGYIIEKAYEFQPLSAMTLALKTIFHKAQLNDPYTGGLSSYGIILLIVYFLNMKKKQGIEISYNTIGQLFFELLVFYQNKENINKPIIINENFVISPLFQLIEQESSLIIVDPLNATNNVAKNVRQLNKILYAFAISVRSLFESCECGCHYQNQYCIREEKCNHNLLNNIFNAVKREYY